MAAKSCRRLPAELAAVQVVKEALRTRGLKMTPKHPVEPLSPLKKINKYNRFFSKRSGDSCSKLAKKLSAVCFGIVEELFEEGSAMLAEMLGNDLSSSVHGTSGFSIRAICQVDVAPSEGIMVNAASLFSISSKPRHGPFLCDACRNKKDAMEGKCPSGVKVL